MRFKYTLVDTLPNLSWCALATKNNDEVMVYHGKMVEVTPLFFGSGAWDDNYDYEGLTKSSFICGTAAYTSDDTICFKSSTDLLSPVFSIAKNGKLYVSNSINFLMQMSGEKPNPLYPFYAYDLVRIARAGLDGAGSVLPTGSRHKIRVFFMSTVTLNRELTVKCVPHPIEPPPNTFEEYKEILRSGLSLLMSNAVHAHRIHRFKAVCTTSRGYDSVAFTSTAAKEGCRRAVTINDSQASDPKHDNGSEICNLFGMQCNEYERRSYLELPTFVEHYFAFTGIGNTPVYSSMTTDLQNSLLITGIDAEYIWSPEEFILNDRLHHPRSRIVQGLNDLEFRLETGYIKIAPAYFAIRHNRKIAAISESKELHNWRLGGDYDRPIPRRLAEENGVPRDAFGMNKMHSGHACFSHIQNLSKSAAENYSSFVKESHAVQTTFKYVYWRIVSLLDHHIFTRFYVKKQRPNPVKPDRLRFVALNCRRRVIPWKQRFMFQWAFQMLKHRYIIVDR